ncbi:MAG TPA: AAA family ATPase, partial [Candidatus Enteromonas pullicola]|nr:AAA family ATPase [Candidatus Enteromonas pullicola]
MRPFYDTDPVKVITGIRRCGKSVVLSQIASEIRKKADNIIYLNFERTSDFNQA